MSVRITSQENVVALFDSTTGAAIGGVFDSQGDAEDFLEYVQEQYPKKVLEYTPQELADIQYQWALEREDRLHDLNEANDA